MIRIALAVVCQIGVGLTVVGLSSVAEARTLEVGPGKEFKAPSAASLVAKPGDQVLIQPGEYFDCATWSAPGLVIEGVGPADKVVITDKSCGGKGLFITTAANITVRNLTLTRARVPDSNGAGIRAEAPGLLVEHVRFINNQNGILAAFEGGTVTVRDSDFVKNGTCERLCAHGIYAGHLDLLRVESSRFSDTRQGHHIKSRALRTEVVGNTITDGETGTASYLVEMPNGGNILVQNNTMEKGPNAENHTGAIVIGAEGVEQPTREILIEGNTFRNDGPWQTFFVVNKTATDATLRNNKLAGSTKALLGDGTSQ